MEKQAKNDLRINGVGSSAGGSFDTVQINGKGEINGDVECNDLQINGLSTINGNIKAETFKVSGKSDIRGDIKSDTVMIDGKIDITGGVTATQVENRGMLGVAKDVSSEAFYSHGGFKIGGLLNADKIQIIIYAPCSTTDIGGEEIDIRTGGASGLREFLGSFFSGWPLETALSVETIEGDNIYLENTTAKVVRGNNIKIGPGCQIDVVEYKDTFEKENDSNIRVNESRKI
ncbi:MAG TPA: polymer-forming cytoskeletal protein [Balneolales bacterium]|nr:polymer-forming cytoskeletal protein [Balneolales bacterium]